jgi:hypothetical protein
MDVETLLRFYEQEKCVIGDDADVHDHLTLVQKRTY